MRRFIQTIAISLLLFAIISCEKKEDTPLELVCDVTSTNVTVHGGHDGTITVTVITGNGNYTFSLNTTNTNIDGKFTSISAGTYSLKVTDAQNKEFTKDVTITEPSLAPTVETGTATFVSVTDVTLNGKINPNGYVTTSVYFEYGSTTSYGTKINLSNISGSTLTSVSSKITNGLSSNTTYHYRLVAINSGGTTYGNDLTFSTYVKPTINSVTTTNIKITSATLNCDVNPQGSLTKIYFEYGTTTSYGSKTIEYNWSNTNSNIVIGSTIINLTPNTVYHYRLVAINSGGNVYSNDITFTTLPIPVPIVSDLNATNLTASSATLSGKINANGYVTTVKFEYGTSTSYGTTINLSNVTGNILTDVSTNINNLTINTIYHYRLVATNDGGTTTSTDFTFNTSSSYNIGDELFGGIVFYVDGTGQHGKVVQKTNESESITYTDAVNLNITRNGATWKIPKWSEIQMVYFNVSNVTNPKITPLSGWYWTYYLSTSDILIFDTNAPSYNGIYHSKTNHDKLRLITFF